MHKSERRRLIALIRDAAVPLSPEAPSLPPEWEALRFSPRPGGIRAALFDVYGTLFCSAAGDISLAAEVDTECAALDALARQYGLAGAELRSFFRAQTAALHRSAPGPWPEVRVEAIWADFLRERGRETAARELALRYELAVNPVYPMPGAAEIIATLHASGLILGIVSNAQFFTPLLFEAFFNANLRDLGFDPPLLIWSCAMGEAKPSPRLFAAAARHLASRGISPAETVFVGNDMRSDIMGAAQAGFRPILFAGDRRSLRLRQEDPRLAALRPARVIRTLAELVPF